MFAATLRRRNQRLAATMAKLDDKSTGGPVPADQTTATTAATLPPPPPPPARDSRFRWAISIFLLVVFAVYQQDKFINKGGKSLPKIYGICSKDGKPSIYTSEVETPAVECVVVDGKRIVDLGSLGAQSPDESIK